MICLMTCPKCYGQFKNEIISGVNVQRCTCCQGLWLSAPELEILQSEPLKDKDLENTMLDAEKSELICPLCANQMQKIEYGFYNLTLIFCARHGYWLSKEQQEDVMEQMDREPNIITKINTQERWVDLLIQLKSPTYWSRLSLLA